jgi:hypothetical protein
VERITPPYFPIIYVRGYAMLDREIADTVATPYMGFNDGSMKERRDFRARPARHAFESPLMRLIKDYQYHDVYDHGDEWALGDSPRLIVIHRYYDAADEDLGAGEHQTVVQAAQKLSDLILRLHDAVEGATARQREDEPVVFGVHLVAHSMGGLVCRAFLQNTTIGSDDARGMVRRVFTYATPHDGIRFRKAWVPSAASLFAENQFNHTAMAKYLGISGTPAHVNTLGGMFPTAQFFCLVGTNHADYTVAYGASRFLVGPDSDGLVQIANATLQGDGPTAYVHRSHSGHYGIVNSEEGYQNLVRFLFAGWRIDGGLKVQTAPLPPSLDRDRQSGLRVETAHNIEIAVTPLGSTGYKLTERKIDHHSAIVSRETELVSVSGAVEQPSDADVQLFSVFADDKAAGVTFNVELAVSPTEYAVDGRADPRRYIPGEYLFQNTIRIHLTRGADEQWTLEYGRTNETAWGETPHERAKETAPGVFEIALPTPKFSGILRIVLTRMTDEPTVRQHAAAHDGKRGPSGDTAIDEPARRGAFSRGYRAFDLIEGGEKEKEKTKETPEKKILEPA